MKITLTSLLGSKVTALLVALVSLAGTVGLHAQTVFLANGVSVASSGAATTVAATGALYNNSGPVTNNVTGLTFGHSFSMNATGPNFGSFTNSFKISGSITGSSISAGTALPVSFDFTLARNNLTAIPGAITWVLKFSDSVNTGDQQIATGSFTTPSFTFTGVGSNYVVTSGVSSGATFLATLELTYFGNNAMSPPEITGTMSNTGFGGGGITLNASAIPEPSTYAAIAGAVTLGLAVWRRRAKLAAVKPGR